MKTELLIEQLPQLKQLQVLNLNACAISQPQFMKLMDTLCSNNSNNNNDSSSVKFQHLKRLYLAGNKIESLHNLINNNCTPTLELKLPPLLWLIDLRNNFILGAKKLKLSNNNVTVTLLLDNQFEQLELYNSE